MKKRFFFLAACAAMLLTGCSSEEGTKGGGSDKAETRYLSVNLMSTPTMGGRAETFEDGITETENKVSAVRFYFFDAKGNAVKVKLQADGSYTNYYDWTEGINVTDQEKINVDAILNTKIVISTKEGDKIPQQIVAIINPDKTKLGTADQSTTSLKAITADYANASNTTAGNFLMCNSVYKGTGEMFATTIPAKSLCSSEADAELNPVEIYVERNVAKVRISSSAIGAVNAKIALNDKQGNPLVVDGQQVYVALKGWDVTATVNKAYMAKHIDINWADNILNERWSSTEYFRSYWAINPGDAENVYPFAYEDVANNKKNFESSFVYANENAEHDAAIKGTKVLIPGELQDANGNPLTVVKYFGVQYAGNKALNTLKEAFIQMLQSNNINYFKAVGNGKASLAPEDIDFKTAADEDLKYAADAEDAGRCFVYAVLKDKDMVLYESDKQDAAPVEQGVIKTYFQKYGKALVWKEGMTYYYYEIDHLGKKGVVRNHIYDMSLKSITGLGTPVYDKSEIIYPEVPNPDETYIAAKINILSWRVIKNDVNLNW